MKREANTQLLHVLFYNKDATGKKKYEIINFYLMMLLGSQIRAYCWMVFSE
jgi:hypothetical protein